MQFWQKYADKRALAVRMLRLLCREFFDDDAPVTAASFERFADMVSGGGSGKLELDGKRTLVFSGGMIMPDRETPPAVKWHWRNSQQIIWNGCILHAETVKCVPEQVSCSEAYFDAGNLPDILSVGAAEPGDVMLPFGGTEPVKVRKLRSERKVPALPPLPLLKDLHGQVLWMAFVRHSAHHPVRPEREIVRIFAEKME